MIGDSGAMWVGDRRGTAGTLRRLGRDQRWQDRLGADLLEGRLWGSDCYDAGGRGAPEELCRRNGVFLFVAGFQAGSCWDLEAARPGLRQQWLPDASLFSGDWLQEVVERAGGSSADGMQHYERVDTTQWVHKFGGMELELKTIRTGGAFMFVQRARLLS